MSSFSEKSEIISSNGNVRNNSVNSVASDADEESIYEEICNYEDLLPGLEFLEFVISSFVDNTKYPSISKIGEVLKQAKQEDRLTSLCAANLIKPTEYKELKKEVSSFVVSLHKLEKESLKKIDKKIAVLNKFINSTNSSAAIRYMQKQKDDCIASYKMIANAILLINNVYDYKELQEFSNKLEVGLVDKALTESFLSFVKDQDAINDAKFNLVDAQEFQELIDLAVEKLNMNQSTSNKNLSQQNHKSLTEKKTGSEHIDGEYDEYFSIYWEYLNNESLEIREGVHDSLDAEYVNMEDLLSPLDSTSVSQRPKEVMFHAMEKSSMNQSTRNKNLAQRNYNYFTEKNTGSKHMEGEYDSLNNEYFSMYGGYVNLDQSKNQGIYLSPRLLGSNPPILSEDKEIHMEGSNYSLDLEEVRGGALSSYHQHLSDVSLSSNLVSHGGFRVDNVESASFIDFPLGEKLEQKDNTKSPGIFRTFLQKVRSIFGLNKESKNVHDYIKLEDEEELNDIRNSSVEKENLESISQDSGYESLESLSDEKLEELNSKDEIQADRTSTINDSYSNIYSSLLPNKELLEQKDSMRDITPSSVLQSDVKAELHVDDPSSHLDKGLEKGQKDNIKSPSIFRKLLQKVRNIFGLNKGSKNYVKLEDEEEPMLSDISNSSVGKEDLESMISQERGYESSESLSDEELEALNSKDEIRANRSSTLSSHIYSSLLPNKELLEQKDSMRDITPSSVLQSDVKAELHVDDPSSHLDKGLEKGQKDNIKSPSIFRKLLQKVRNIFGLNKGSKNYVKLEDEEEPMLSDISNSSVGKEDLESMISQERGYESSESLSDEELEALNSKDEIRANRSSTLSSHIYSSLLPNKELLEHRDSTRDISSDSPSSVLQSDVKAELHEKAVKEGKQI